MRISLMSYERLEVAVRKKFGTASALTFRIITRSIGLYTPLFLVRFVPNFFSSICSSYLLNNPSNEERLEAWLRNLHNIPAYRKVYLHRRMHFLFRKPEKTQLISFIEELLESPDGRIFVSEWIYFNLNQDLMISHFQRNKIRLSNLDSDKRYSHLRFLPDHTKHMGHIGFLALYDYFYSKQDSSRTIAIWPHLAPNAFYLKRIIENSRLKYRLMAKESWGRPINEFQKDTIMMSRISQSIWRFEPLIAAGTNQEFPEFDIDEGSLLRPDSNSHELSLKKLTSIGFDPNRWFVILHIKEDGLGYSISGETRDANIIDYIPACHAVRELGGQVVRMGSPSFPRLSKSFPAIDYAYSQIRSDVIDYWLWANCRSWIGNCNGASVAVIPFGKPRLLTNQWPIDPNGPSKDFVLPKLVFSEETKRFLTFGESVEIDHARSMNRSLLKRSGLKIIDNPPEVIAQSLVQLLVRENALPKYPNFHKLELGLHSATKTPIGTPKMRFTESFIGLCEDIALY